MTQTLEERNKLRRERYAKNRLDPEYMSRRREYERNRYKNNPLTPKQKKAKYEWTKKHRKENPDYRTNLYSRLSQDPEWVIRSRAYQKESRGASDLWCIGPEKRGHVSADSGAGRFHYRSNRTRILLGPTS